MRKIYGWLGAAGMGLVTAAALVLQSCASQHSANVRQPNPGAQPAAQPGMNQPWSEVGVRSDAAVNSDGGVYRVEPHGGIPQIDLQQALGGSQGGGGAGGQIRFGINDNDMAWGFSNARTREGISAEASKPRSPNSRGERSRPEIILRPGEELWVIQKSYPRVVVANDDTPGCGSLMTRREIEGAWREVPVPLAHTAVEAKVEGYISSVNVTQKFHNPFDSKIEAMYVFPLPEDAAVNDFLMTVGTRTIRGVIRERDEAEKIYERARRAGHVASLMTQDRPNIFTQAVANIEPGKEIDIGITYLNCLPYRDGSFEFVFPMVVGPRFNPPSTLKEGTGVAAVGYGTAAGAGTQQTEIQYLRPHQRSGADVSVAVEINAGVSIESLESPSHAITVEHDRSAPTLAKVRLDASETIANRDFVLRYRVSGNATKTAMLLEPDGRSGRDGKDRGGFFSMLLVPPSDLSYIERGPVEVVFLIDCSGSMNGEPLEQAKAAARHALARLDPDDTFQIINFSDSASQLGGEPLEASRRNLERGLAYLDSLASGGGTMMMNGVQAALGYRHDPKRTRFVCFLTDGFIGNDAEVLGFVRERLGQSRIMSIGIGSAPNRYLLEGLGRLGKGAAAFLNPGDKPEEIMDLFLERIAHAALTDVSIDWAGLGVEDVYPKRLPDLYVGRPVMVTGRYTGTARGPVKVKGRAGREKLETALPVIGVELADANRTARVAEEADGKPAPFGSGRSTSIASIWARKKIEELSDKATSEDGPRVQGAIRQTALEFGLMSAYTAFVAVDSMTKTAGSYGTTVAVPVPVPAGVRYETTVTEHGQRR